MKGAKLMNILGLITSKLSSKEFEDEKLYFDKNGKVCLIESKNRITYPCVENGEYVLHTELLVGKTITVPQPNGLNNLFIIPGIDKRDDIELMNEGLKEYSFPVSELPECLFEVVSYGLAEDPMFKGVLMSRSIINVAVENSIQRIYQIKMTLGEGVRSGDGNPFGDIKDAYKLTSLCSIDGKVIKFTV